MTELRKKISGEISEDNSSDLLLNAGETFTGESTDVTNFGYIFITSFSDVESATDGLRAEQSSDGTNWDINDIYTVDAGRGIIISIQPGAKFFRVIYTNGSTNQTEFRLQTMFKETGSLSSSHRIDDDVSSQDDATLITAVLKTPNSDRVTYSNMDVQNPLMVDGDSVYGKDLDLSRTIIAGWTGDVNDLFGDLTLGLIDSSGTSPKTMDIFFQRTIITNSMGLGAETGNFSNVKITALLSGGITFVLHDGSADSTLRTSQTIQFLPLGFVGIRIEFFTTFAVTLTNLVILKSISTVSRLQALKPDGTVVNVDATNGGNLKMSLEELESGVSSNNNKQLNVTTFDSQGNETPLPLTAFQDLRTAPLRPQFQASFEYTVNNTELNINSVAGGGTVTQSNAMAVVSTSTTTSSMAMLESKRHARYKSGLGGLVRFTALFTSPVATTEQYIGLADEMGSSQAFKNGYMMGYTGTSFGFHRFQNDVLISVDQENWDDPMDGTGGSGMVLDQTKLNVFAISYQYLGAGPIRLFVENEVNGVFTLVHTIKYTNNNIEPSVHNPNFHFIIHVDNKSTTSDLIVKTGSYAYFVEGETRYIELHQPQFSSEERSKTTVTTEVAIFTIRNKSTYVSKTNFIDIALQLVGGSIEASSANNLGELRLVRDATLGGTPSWSDINATNSVVEIDTSGTTVTGGKEIIPVSLAGKNDRSSSNLVDFDMIISPGETVTLAGSSDNSATIKSFLTWKELF